MPKALLTTVEIRAREEARKTKELNRKNAFNNIVAKHLSSATLKKHCSTQTLEKTADGDAINDIIYTTYQNALILRIHHITEKFVILEKMEAVPVPGYMWGTDRYTVGQATGNYIKVANRIEERNYRLGIKGISLFRLNNEGVIYHTRHI